MGPNNSFDYNTTSHKFSTPITTPGSAGAKSPHLYHSQDYGDFQASGQGLLSALNLFNSNHLVTDPLGQTVGWNASGAADGPYFDVSLNGANDFWSILHVLTTGKGLFEGIL